MNKFQSSAIGTIIKIVWLQKWVGSWGRLVMCTSSARSNRVQNVVNIYWSKRMLSFRFSPSFCLTRIYSIVNPESWGNMSDVLLEILIGKWVRWKRVHAGIGVKCEIWLLSFNWWCVRAQENFLLNFQIDSSLISAICIIKDMREVPLKLFPLWNRFLWVCTIMPLIEQCR